MLTAADQEIETADASGPTAHRETVIVEPLTGHIDALDGLRGAAVLAVMGLHFSHGVPEDSHYMRLFSVVVSAGWTGVDLFFVLSGFLITRILLRDRDRPNYYKNFYIRRSLRIFPVYYAVLVLVGLASLLIPAWRTDLQMKSLSSAWPWYWFYLTNYLAASEGWVRLNTDRIALGHFWTLAIEEHFYLFWPLVVRALSTRRLVFACVTIILLAFIGRWSTVVLGQSHYWTAFATHCRADTLAVGALLALCTVHRQAATALRFLGPAAAISTVGLMVYAVTRGELDSEPEWFRLFGFPLIAVPCAYLVSAASTPGTVAAGAFSIGWLRSLGKYSYGIYIYHGLLVPPLLRAFSVPVMRNYLPRMSLAVIAHYVACIGVSVACAVLSYHLFEKHWLKLKDRFQ